MQGIFIMPTREQKLEYKRRYRIKNKEKIQEYNRTHIESQRRRSRKTTIKEHGLTLEQYQEMYDEQNGCCAICSIHQNELKQALCVDHNHQTNKIRGLLCGKCNRGIGYLNDNIDLLQAAINYLKIND